jgi:putative hydrolase of the HAD superfamily
MKKLEHIFFDLDRTLWDFERNSKSALVQLFHELKLDCIIESFESFHEVYRKINAEYWEDYTKGRVSKEKLRIGRFHDTLVSFGRDDIQLSTLMAEGYVKISPYQTHLFPGTKEVLQELSDRNYQLHIITNGFKEVQFIKLENSGLRPFFQDVLCSEEVGKNKPNPEIFHAALERTNAKNTNSLMIGDDFEADILGAERVGIRAVLFDPHDVYEARKEIERIKHFEELPFMLNKPMW